MSDPFIGEIRLLANNFTPSGWLSCTGETFPIHQYEALFAVIGVRFGGNVNAGNFAVPNLDGRAIVGAGAGPGLVEISFGEHAGVTSVELTAAASAAHSHNWQAVEADGAAPTLTPTSFLAQGHVSGGPVALRGKKLYTKNSPDKVMAGDILAPAGGNASGGANAHSNIQPCIGMNYYICYDGVFPVHQS